MCQKLTIANRERGGEVYEPPILADVICEQPLICISLEKHFKQLCHSTLELLQPLGAIRSL